MVGYFEHFSLSECRNSIVRDNEKYGNLVGTVQESKLQSTEDECIL
jgi:hypothetical protein